MAHSSVVRPLKSVADSSVLRCVTLGGRQAIVGRLLTRALLPMSLLWFGATPAFSADWRFTAIRSTAYGTSLTFLDASSLRGGNGQVSFRAATYFSRKTRGMNRV